MRFRGRCEPGEPSAVWNHLYNRSGHFLLRRQNRGWLYLNRILPGLPQEELAKWINRASKYYADIKKLLNGVRLSNKYHSQKILCFAFIQIYREDVRVWFMMLSL